MRCWVDSPGPAGLGLERARSKVVSLFAVTSEAAGIPLEESDDLLVFSSRVRPGLSLCRIVVPRALSRKLTQASARGWRCGAARGRERSVERLAGDAGMA